MKSVTVTVKGAPKAKKRPKFTTRAGAKFGRAYNPSEKDEISFWQAVEPQVRGVYYPKDVPLDLYVLYTIERPKSHYGTGKNAGVVKASAPAYPTGKPDADNLLKLLCDALNCQLWHDDAQVVDVRIGRRYGPEGETHFQVDVMEESDYDVLKV